CQASGSGLTVSLSKENHRGTQIDTDEEPARQDSSSNLCPFTFICGKKSSVSIMAEYVVHICRRPATGGIVTSPFEQISDGALNSNTRY
ncbi:MAG: hypothetical protein KDB01_06185, partial [Planctomycetaceae bacterium]|nr:hypothetical protein [Planctomycetaceae bacterium]